jgi:2-methylisocitrate lyase-like PEP mutase family enzyme
MGVSDIGLMTPAQRLDAVFRLKGVTDLPIVVDGEGGWGDAPQVAYWVREFARAGAAGIMLEDKTGALATPYIKGTKPALEPVKVAIRKIRAAAAARPSPDFLIVARSSARRTLGMDEQLRRLAAYREAGADILWASSDHPDVLRRYRDALDGPLWATCNINSGAQRSLDLDDFRSLGIQVVAYETPIYLVGLKATVRAAQELRRTGSIAPLERDMAPLEEFLRLAGFGEAESTARRYGLLRRPARHSR